ncbi:MAG: DEAD/DEAH box helicase, partial [Verrucomicrobiales bacterium]|nr:DEAD/DEAH box helicase [Verrucomicrobiales bacterium]
HKALTVPTVQQMYYEVHSRSKFEVLCRVLDIEAPRLAIIFANTKRTVDDVTDALLARGYSADRLHGDLSQQLRERVMRNFRNGSVEVLVATDVAARGLDVDDVDLVVNFEPPYDEEDYVHRIGRTGRAGRSGKAVCLVSGREIFLLQRIMRYAKVKIDRRHVPSREELEGLRADSFFEKLREKLESGGFRSHEDTLQRLLDAGQTTTDVFSALMDLWLAESAKEREEIMEDRPKPAPRAHAERSSQEQRPTRHDEDAPGSSEAPDRRRLPQGPFTRLFINLGAIDNVGPGDIAGAIYRLAQLPAGSLGKIEIFERSSYVGVPPEHVELVIQSVSDTKWRGRPLRMNMADRQEAPESHPTRGGRFRNRSPREDEGFGFRKGAGREENFRKGPPRSSAGGPGGFRDRKPFKRNDDRRPPFDFPGKGGGHSKPFKRKKP